MGLINTHCSVYFLYCWTSCNVTKDRLWSLYVDSQEGTAIYLDKHSSLQDICVYIQYGWLLEKLQMFRRKKCYHSNIKPNRGSTFLTVNVKRQQSVYDVTNIEKRQAGRVFRSIQMNLQSLISLQEWYF